MAPYSDKPRYDAVTMLLHWVTAILIIAAYIIVQIADELPRGSVERTSTFDLHKSVGVTVFALVLIRLVWRSFHAAPALPRTTTPLLALAAKAGHLALYALMLAVPVIGILMVEAKGRVVGVWGLFDLPVVIGADKALGHTLEEAHELVGNLIMIVAGLHALAALFHQFVLRDGLLARMSPWGAR